MQIGGAGARDTEVLGEDRRPDEVQAGQEGRVVCGQAGHHRLTEPGREPDSEGGRGGGKRTT